MSNKIDWQSGRKIGEKQHWEGRDSGFWGTAGFCFCHRILTDFLRCCKITVYKACIRKANGWLQISNAAFWYSFYLLLPEQIHDLYNGAGHCDNGSGRLLDIFCHLWIYSQHSFPETARHIGAFLYCPGRLLIRFLQASVRMDARVSFARADHIFTE